MLWFDAAEALVHFYRQQNRRVMLVANAAWAEWARTMDIFDEVISVDRQLFNTRWRYRFSIARLLRSKRFSIAIQPTYSREHTGDALIHLSGASERTGSIGDLCNLRSWQKRFSDRWYTRLLAADPAPRMELLRNAEFLRVLGVPNYQARIADLRRFIRPGDVAEFGLMEEAPYFVLFPGASWSGRRWPLEKFAHIAKRMYAETGFRGIVCGGPDDVKEAASLCEAASEIDLLNLAGCTTLSQMTSLIGKASLLVSNDTAALHIGVAVGTPTVGVLGGGHFGRFLPYQVEQRDKRPLPEIVWHAKPCFGCNWQCIYPVESGFAVPCIEEVSLTQVWDAVRSALDATLLRRTLQNPKPLVQQASAPTKRVAKAWSPQ